MSWAEPVSSQDWSWQPPVTPGAGEIEWWVQIACHGADAQGALNDFQNYAGVAGDAKSGGALRADDPLFDGYDILEGPETPRYVKICFPYSTADFCQVIQPPANDLSWPVKVVISYDGEVTLAWDVSTVPSSYQHVLLKDLSSGSSIDMRTTGEYSYTSPAEQSRRFTLSLSTAEVPPEDEGVPPEEEETPSGEEPITFPEEATTPPEEGTTPPEEAAPEAEAVEPEEEAAPEAEAVEPEKEAAPEPEVVEPEEKVVAPPAAEEAAPQQPVAPVEKSEINWTILGIIIGAVVIIGVVVFLLVRRRAY